VPDPKVESKAEFLAAVERLSDEQQLTTHAWFEDALQSLNESLSPPECKKVVDFAAEQRARWQADWLFSPASAPNNTAAEELREWNHLWDAWAGSLVEAVPKVEEQVRSLRDVVGLEHALKRRMLHTEGAPWEKAKAITLSKLSFLFDSIGLQGAARWLYKRALFPAGSVGRRGDHTQPVDALRA
jgi:hypothetical protein